MIAPQKNKPEETVQFAWQQRFLEMLPDIRRHALFAFRSLRGEAKEEAIAETIANVFVAFVRLMERKRGEKVYSSVLTRFAVAQIRCGRKVGTSLNTRDILTRAAQVKHGFRVERLENCDDGGGEWADFVLEDRRTPVPDQAAFRCDFPAWLETQSPRNRRIAERLAAGDTTSEVAQSFEISAGRVSQIRRELADSWREFHGELGICNQAAAATSV